MKKFVALLLALCLAVGMTSCHGFDLRLSGLDQYQPGNSFGFLTEDFIPDGFISMFPYTDGGYEYEDRLGSDDIERAVMWLQYDESSYEKAKAYAVSHMDLAEKEIGSYEGYRYRINFQSFRPYGKSFPTYFVVMGYHDTEHILVFLGFYFRGTLNEEYTDFGTFVHRVFDENFPPKGGRSQ